MEYPRNSHTPLHQSLRHICAFLLGVVLVLTVLSLSSLNVLNPRHLPFFNTARYFSTPNRTIVHFYHLDKHGMRTFRLSGQAKHYKEVPSEHDGLDGDRSILLSEQRLHDINIIGPDGVQSQQTHYAMEEIHDITNQRLRLRASRRLERASFFAEKLQNATPVAPDTLYVSHVIYDGGLGNWMFMVGATYGVARMNGRRPSLLKHYRQEDVFENFHMEKKNRTELLGDESLLTFHNSRLYEHGPGIFAQAVENITSHMGPRNMLLSGYLQTWRYFHQYRDEIRSLFTFSRSVFETSLQALDKKLAEYLNTSTAAIPHQLPTLVGIHVRRGDILRKDQAKHGHTPASGTYLLRSALHFQRSYKSVIFVVLSNDLPYCRDLFREPNFIFMDGNSEAVDLAIYSLMDHLIISVGSYAWWGAYLSDAKEIFYFRDWPRRGSIMAGFFNLPDYFLPTWKPSD